SDGMVDVPLRDPAKPRAAAPEPAQPAGGPPSPATATPGGFPQPQMPSPGPGLPPQTPPASALPGAFPQPPGLRRRLPVLPAPGTPSPAPAGERRPTPAPPIAPPVPAAQRGRFVVLNFDNADVETVVHAASEILGFNYVLAPDVRGKVTVQTSGRIPQEEVFNLLLAVLEVHGFTAVRSENLYKIVRLPDAATRGVPTIVGTAPDP